MYRDAMQAIDRNDLDALARMVDTGLVLDAIRLDAMHPPLHWSAYRGREKVVRWLLARGARASHDAVGAADWAYLPTHGAIYGRHGPIADLLVDQGCPVDLPMAVHLADDALVRQLVRKEPRALTRRCWHLGYSVLHLAADIDRANMIGLLVELGLDPDVEDPSGHAPLRYAAGSATGLAAMQALVAAGADVNHASRTGVTALAYACRHAQNLVGVRWLLARGADANILPRDGNGPLHLAVANRQLELVRLLAEAGANPDLPGKDGKTARQEARRKGPQVVAALEVSPRSRID